VAFDAGYESLSVFNEHFRRRLGLTPRAYRGLRGAMAFTIALPRWYPFELLRGYLGRDPQSLGERLDTSSADSAAYAFAMTLAGVRAARVHVRLERRHAVVDFNVRKTADGDAATVFDQVRARLGLVFDPLPFERHMTRRGGDAARLIAGRRGLVVPQTGGVSDGLLWVIVGQQVSLASAFSIRRRVLERFGLDAGEGLRAPPPFVTFADAGQEALTGAGLSRPKASYLEGIAREVASGELNLESLRNATAPEVERRLLALRGLGAWSVNYLMMRALALQDCVPIGDVALAKSLGQFFNLDQRPNDEETRRLMASFAPYRSLATFHLWHRSSVAPPLTPNSNPRPRRMP
jgi:AraC family transcriptional regulator of adaptative response / DNA-3-methyladenine glycosylase II